MVVLPAITRPPRSPGASPGSVDFCGHGEGFGGEFLQEQIGAVIEGPRFVQWDGIEAERAGIGCE